MHFDSRSLAFFRMALGAIVFGISWQLAPDLPIFFYPSSVHPYFIKSLVYFILPLFSFALACGFLSRFSTLVCWVGIVILQQANPAFFSGSDKLLRVLFYWSLFLPLGRSWSVDGMLFRSPPPNLPLTDYFAPWAITLQVCSLYWSTGLLKLNPMWVSNGNALSYILDLEDLDSPFGHYLRQFPLLLHELTHATVFLELFGPFLLFIPIYRKHLWMTAVVLFTGFHLIGIQGLLELGSFPWVCAAAWLIFIPGFFWDFLIGGLDLPVRSSPSLSKRSRLFDLGVSALLIFSCVVATAWNVESVYNGDQPWMNRYDFTRNFLHLNQGWFLFSPAPPEDHGWLLFPAELEDGTQLDLFTSNPVSKTKPPNPAAYVGDIRRRNYFEHIMHDGDQDLFRACSDYLVLSWNQRHPPNQRVKNLSILYMRQTTHADLTISEPEPIPLYSRNY